VKILILGGTSDARKIAVKLLKAELTVIYSVAGLVRTPKLDCQVISGGFSQRGGLAAFLTSEAVEVVVDATHPYAVKMTAQAVLVCEQLAVPYVRFARPAWRAKPEDRWVNVADWQPLLEKCAAYDRPFLTLGQLEQGQLDAIAVNSVSVTYRTAAASQAVLTDNVNWLKAIGPFAFEDELVLMQRLNTDVLVCKNAGGEATYAKIFAARVLKIPVIMLRRPAQKCLTKERVYSRLGAVVNAVKILQSTRLSES